MKKKLLSIVCVGAIITSLSITPAMAHGGSGHSNKTYTTSAVTAVANTANKIAGCTTAGCLLDGTHQHNGVDYMGNHADHADHNGINGSKNGHHKRGL